MKMKTVVMMNYTKIGITETIKTKTKIVTMYMV